MCIWQLEPLHTGNNISIDPSPSKIEEEVLDMAKIEDIQVFQVLTYLYPQSSEDQPHLASLLVAPF